MTERGHNLDATRRYYDDFAERYEDARAERKPNGYHALVDGLELEFLERFARGKSVLEVGCGTGLLLKRIETFASEARGVDLSPGMLAKAKARHLQVQEASALALPFPDASFDVVCSFKVLAHVEPIALALQEAARVVRPNGTLVLEFYNRRSVRAVVKRLGPAGAISASRTESEVYTRFDDPSEMANQLPAGWRLVDERGVRILTPAAQLLDVPLLGSVLAQAERRAADSPLRRYGGFWIGAFQRTA